MTMPPSLRSPSLGAILTALLCSCRATPPTENHQPLFDRVAVIGASVSAGVGLHYELGAHVSLVPVLESIMSADAVGPQALPPLDMGNYFMFRSPIGFGTNMVEATLAYDASLVIAVDFLFWFTHGDLSTQERHDLLEVGLGLLDRLTAPMLVGDLPDVSYALSGHNPLYGGPIIKAFKIPATAERQLLNARIREWVEARPRVSLAPFEDFAARAVAGDSIQLPQGGLVKGGVDALIQSDHLHPTLAGGIALLLTAMDVLVRDQGIPPHQINWDQEQVRTLFMKRTQPKRNAARDRRQRIRKLVGDL